MLDEQVAALRARIERAAGDGHDFAAGLVGKARGDQRAGFGDRFDHHGADREAGDDAVARGEVARLGLGAGGLFGEQKAFGGDAFLQRGVVGRVGDVDAAGDDADRGTAGASAERADVCGGVDAAGQAGDDRRALLGELQRELAGEAAGGGGCVARADHRDAGAAGVGDVAAEDQGRGCGLDLG